MKEYEYKDLSLGIKESFQKEVKEEDLILFSNLTGDKNPLHLDKNYSLHTKFKKPVVFGMLIASLLSTLAGMYLPGKYSLILSIESSFKKPGFVGDTLKISGEIESKVDSQKMIVLKTEISNQKSEILQTGKMYIQVLK